MSEQLRTLPLLMGFGRGREALVFCFQTGMTKAISLRVQVRARTDSPSFAGACDPLCVWVRGVGGTVEDGS
jgi:hypothetical protein